MLSLGTSDFDLNVVLFKENVSAIKKYGLLLNPAAKFKELKFDCQKFFYTLGTMEQQALQNANNCLNTNIYSYIETSGSKSSNLCLNVVHFLTLVLIRYLRQLMTIAFLHCCQIRVVQLCPYFTIQSVFLECKIGQIGKFRIFVQLGFFT